MNKNLIKSLGVIALASGGLVGLASCGASGPEQSETVFENARFYYDTSVEEAYNISVDIGTTANVTALASGRNAAESGQYINRNGILTIGADFLGSLTAGEKTITVTTDEGRVSVDGYFVHKVITTAEEFQNINERLDGYYILGNDIDLSSISNFEPLGYYFDETSTANAYFHGILDGNGYTVKNAKVHFSDSVATNYGVYTNSGTTKFQHGSHVAGDNIGLFQVIGSSGEVRNVKFSNIDVMGRTIVGAIAGNNMGNVHDVYVDSQCDVQMATHFYDDDCNMGGAFGIVAGTGTVRNVVSEIDHLQIGAAATTSQTYNGTALEIVTNCYLDFGDDYPGQVGNGWDHPASGDAINDPWWRFAGVDKVDGNSAKYNDSNGAPTNGQYAFVGKCWGTVSNVVAKSFQITEMNSSSPRDVYFGQTHLAANKPTSGDTDLGSITDCTLVSDLTDSSLYSAFDADIWNIASGSVPTLKTQYTSHTVAAE